MSAEKTPEFFSEPWLLATQTGLQVSVCPSMRSVATYVLLEQEGWYEPELSLLPRLLQRGMHGLDVGADHGLYSLEMARCVPGGRVWAFEADNAARANLQRSVQANGWGERLTVVPAALAEAPGFGREPAGPAPAASSAPPSAPAAAPAVAAMAPAAAAAGRDPLRVETLDHYLGLHAPGVAIDFIRLSADCDVLAVLVGGEQLFAQQSPVVQMGVAAGEPLGAGVLAGWHLLGYDLFRWSAELGVLLPFDADADETASLLNLVAVRPEVQGRLALRGLLVSAAALAEAQDPLVEPRALSLWFARPALPSVDSSLHGGATPDTAVQPYLKALAAVASAHFQPRLSPAERVLLMLSARTALMPALEGHLGYAPEPWTLLVHCLQALGQPHAALLLAQQVLDRWPEDERLTLPVAPPCVADLQRPRSTPIGPWLRQMLSEFVALRSQLSSCCEPPAPARWAALLAHPDHGAEVERRYLLSHMVQDRVAPVDGLKRLPSPVHTCNPMLWQALMQAMQTMAPDVPDTRSVKDAPQRRAA
jgi:FkbM family methyltransferase